MVKLKISEPNTKTHIIRQGFQFYAMEFSNDIILPLKHHGILSLTPDDTVFSFEYKSDGELWQAVVSVSKEKTISISNIPPSENWSSISINISELIANFRDISYLSNTPLFLTLIPLPTSPSVNFQIKNIRIREADTVENRQKQKRNEFRAHKQNKCFPGNGNWSGRIERITSSQSVITVSGSINSRLIPYILCEIPVWSDFPEQIICPISADVNGNFSVSLPRFEKYDRLFSRFVIAVSADGDISVASSPRYVDSIETANAIQEPMPKNKKGLGNFSIDNFVSDLDELQISYITVNIRINDFIRLKRKSGKDIAFEFGGSTYYADYHTICRYDSILLEAKSRGIIVCAILLVCPVNSSSDKEVGIVLEHPEYNTAGKYSMPDLTSEESVNLYSAAIDFLASRYSRPDGRFGYIHRWIIHNEIDAAWIWCNAGQKNAEEFTDIYLKSVRLVRTIVLQHNSNAQFYIPLSHFWNARYDLRTGYSGCQLLNLIKAKCNSEGDFPWGIAYHPYPETLWSPESWLDVNATPDDSTPLVTFKNIEVLDKWAERRENRYLGSKRSIILSEQNPASKDYSEESQQLQAASLAYVWRKLKSCKNIEAYIAHSWIDAHYEGGLKTGLRKYPDDPDDPGGKKLSWYVMRDIGTENEQSVMDNADEIINTSIKNDIRF